MPLIFADRQLYAIPAILGAGAVGLLWTADLWSWWTAVLVAVVVLGFRLLALWRGWLVPHVGVGWTGRWGRDSGSMDT